MSDETNLFLWACKARRTADPPQDCDWPTCGCDPYANKVIDALEESGKLSGAAPQPFDWRGEMEALWRRLATAWEEHDESLIAAGTSEDLFNGIDCSEQLRMAVADLLARAKGEKP